MENISLQNKMLSGSQISLRRSNLLGDENKLIPLLNAARRETEIEPNGSANSKVQINRFNDDDNPTGTGTTVTAFDRNFEAGSCSNHSISNELQDKWPAIRIRSAIKSYGDKRILKGLDMTVERGNIYSLLGSSGCGKTTLLTCIVGVKHLDCGEILVFGAKPGTRESGIPGRTVGYMPQDTALYGAFTIKETLQYYGTLHGMSNEEISAESGVMMDFLDLPEPTKKVGSMSGGQKRRLSLAVALLHSPELIILDEPTVGVDPLLRESIWNYLMELVSVNNVTVIITTHYIDEAKHSNMVGVMRDGKILSERSPQILYEEFKTTFLEDIVLKLCHEDEQRGKAKKGRPILNRHKYSKENPVQVTVIKDEREYKFSPSFPTMGEGSCLTRIKAMTEKNIRLTFRNYLFAIFLILTPSIVVLSMYVAIGTDPKPLKVGIINKEVNGTSSCKNFSHGSCNQEGFSCLFIDKLPSDIVELHPMESEYAAEQQVREGKLLAYMYFPEKYSESVYLRVSGDISATAKTLRQSVIRFRMDESEPVISGALKNIFHKTYKVFVAGLLAECGFNPEMANSPLEFEKPIHGGGEHQLRDTTVLHFVVGVIYFFPMCSSSIAYVWDKKQGTMERARVAGARTWEILLASLLTELAILSIQSSIVFAILLQVFDISVLGSHLLAFALIVITGAVGISNGFLWAAICSEEIEAVMLSMVSYFPGYFLSGMLWPVIGMNKGIQYLAYFLPVTYPSAAMKAIVSKGMDISYEAVWPGFVGPCAWIAGFCVLTIVIQKMSLARQ